MVMNVDADDDDGEANVRDIKFFFFFSGVCVPG